MLIFPPKKVACGHCTTTNVGGLSTNVYVHGGPAPFNSNYCVSCGGNGTREEQVTGTIRLRMYWRQRDWIKVSEISFPDADVQVIGYLTDLPNLKKANEVRLNNQYGDWRFQLSGENFPHGFGKNRYFVAFLKRI